MTFSFDEGDQRYEVRHELSPSEEYWEPDQTHHLLEQDHEFDNNFDEELNFLCAALVALLRNAARELATPALMDATSYLVTSISNQP